MDNGENMVRKKNLNTKEERLFLAAKAIKESIIRNLPIEDGGYNCPILVEGINDVKCLRALGFLGIIETVNKGWDRPRMVAYLHETYGAKLAIDGLPRIILLMDWDRTGGRLQKKIVESMAGLEINVSDELRQVLSKAMKPDTRCVEDLTSFLGQDDP